MMLCSQTKMLPLANACFCFAPNKKRPLFMAVKPCRADAVVLADPALDLRKIVWIVIDPDLLASKHRAIEGISALSRGKERPAVGIAGGFAAGPCAPVERFGTFLHPGRLKMVRHAFSAAAVNSDRARIAAGMS